MSLQDYYHQTFRADLGLMYRGMVAHEVRYRFGNDWVRDCSLLPRVPDAHRSPLVVCLYFTVLVDQGMHSYFPQFHRRFEELTQYPKFLVGFGHEAHLNPMLLFQIPIQRGLVLESAVRGLISEGMQLFVRETSDFFRRHMPEISTAEFFERLLADPDAVRTYSDSPSDASNEAESLGQLIGTALRRAVADATASK